MKKANIAILLLCLIMSGCGSSSDGIYKGFDWNTTSSQIEAQFKDADKIDMGNYTQYIVKTDDGASEIYYFNSGDDCLDMMRRFYSVFDFDKTDPKEVYNQLSSELSETYGRGQNNDGLMGPEVIWKTKNAVIVLLHDETITDYTSYSITYCHPDQYAEE